MKLLNKFKTNVKSVFDSLNNSKIKWIPLEQIIIDPEIKSIFIQKEKDIVNITDDIIHSGFDPAHPCVLTRSQRCPELNDILADGHTRLEAARRAGITQIAVIYKGFNSREELIEYAYKQQLNRRNLSDQEIYNAYVLLSKMKKENGKLENTEQELANKLEISRRQVGKMKEVERKASPEVFESFRSGELSLNKAYKKMKEETNPDSSKTASTNIPNKGKVIVTKKVKSEKTYSDGFSEGIKYALHELANGKSAETLLAELTREASHE